jgi:hypothetical protein
MPHIRWRVWGEKDKIPTGLPHVNEKIAEVGDFMQRPGRPDNAGDR